MSDISNSDLSASSPRDPELDELLGAYALDVLEPDEADRVERYLATNPEARAEADRLAHAIDEVAVADDDVAVPSADLWDRISSSLPPRPERVAEAVRVVVPDQDPSEAPTNEPADDEAPDDLPNDLADDLTARRARRAARRSPGRLTLAVLAAAAVVVVAVLGVAALRRSDTSSTTSVAARLEAEADQVASQPGSRSGTLTGPDGASVRVVIDADGRGFVLPSSLAALSPDQTYQLWSVDGGQPVSLGLLGRDPTVAVVGASGNPDQLAITAEPVGGSSAPTSNPVVVGTLS